MDSNQRRRKPADLQSAPFSRSGIYPLFRWTAKVIRSPELWQVEKSNFLKKSFHRRESLDFHMQSTFAVLVFLCVAAPEDRESIFGKGSDAARIFQQQLPIALQEVFEFAFIVAR